MKYKYDKEAGRVVHDVSNAVDCLDYIMFIAIDYDSARTIEDYKKLVDDLSDYAAKAKEFIDDLKVTTMDTVKEDIASFEKAKEDFKRYNMEEGEWNSSSI